MNTAVGQSAGYRLRLGLAVLLLLVAQIAAVAHFIGHAAEGDTESCTLCLHAGQSGSALLPSALPQTVFRPITSVVVTTVEAQISRTYPGVYRSRAPPLYS